MSNAVRGCLLIVAISAVAPSPAEAQLGNFGQVNPCQDCLQPLQTCTCTSLRPVVETQYRKQKFVTYRDVTTTQYQQATCVESVPVTTYKDVTVDAGSYQMVWVPKLVTQKVPCTTCQQRVKHITVPYQVTQRVPEVQSRLVPYQTVRYVPETTQMVLPSNPTNCVNSDCVNRGGFSAPSTMPAPNSFMPGSSYNPAPQAPPNSGYFSQNGQVPPPVSPYTPGDSSDSPLTVPTMPSITVPSSDSLPPAPPSENQGGEHVPSPQFLDTPGLPPAPDQVQSDSSATRRLPRRRSPVSRYEEFVPETREASLGSRGQRGLFVPASPEIAAWRAQWNRE